MPAEQQYFEDLEIGAVHENPSQTVTDAHFQFFAGLTGDFNPLHMDEQYIEEQTDFEGRVAHGMLVTLFTVLGASTLSPNTHDSMVAFLNQSSTFLEPVYVGDTIHPELELVAKQDKGDKGIVTFESRVYNQDDEQVLEGELEFLVRKRPDSG